MERVPIPRRLSASIALVGWLVAAGLGDAAWLLSRALGTHGSCGMPCCRDSEDACLRMAGGSHHAGRARDRDGISAPSTELFFSAISSCDTCALLEGVSRVADSPTRALTIHEHLQSSDSIAVSEPELSRRLFLDSLPARAPPA